MNHRPRQSLDRTATPVVVDSEGRIVGSHRCRHDADERDLSRLQAEVVALDHAATHDPLTGLPNRLGLSRRFDEVADASGGCSMLYLDLDGFKPINDRYGHAVGDAVLCVVASRLRRTVRPTDMIARVGGDEFVVLVPGRERRSGLVRIARRIDRCLSDPVAVGRVRARLSASIGLGRVDSTGTLDRLMHDADTAMYAAKRERRRRRIETTQTCTV